MGAEVADIGDPLPLEAMVMGDSTAEQVVQRCAQAIAHGDLAALESLPCPWIASPRPLG